MDRLVRETDVKDDDNRPQKATADGSDGRSAWQFRLVVLRHHRPVYRMCFGILGDRHEAEDVTQEAFLRYWQLSGEVRGTRAWLMTVARNKCLDRLRSAKRLVDADPELFEQQTDGHDPEWHASRDQSLSRLENLIKRLPEPQRSLVLLFDVEGMTGAECAEILDLNVNQVKVYLHRARRQLRQALEDHHD